MLKLWAKIIKNHQIQKDIVLEVELLQTKAETVKNSLTELALSFDMARPIWLPKNGNDLKQFVVTRFFPDQFMESLEFDYLEIEIIDNQKKKKNH